MTTHPPTAPLALIAALLALPAAGCGEGAGNRQAVSGTVTMNGAPLNDATIEFVPMGEGSGSFSGASILDGQYKLSANRGLAPGEYRVMISMAGSAPDPVLDEAPGDTSVIPVAPQLIPARYNSESGLTAKVEAGGANQFDFDLKK